MAVAKRSSVRIRRTRKLSSVAISKRALLRCEAGEPMSLVQPLRAVAGQFDGALNDYDDHSDEAGLAAPGRSERGGPADHDEICRAEVLMHKRRRRSGP
jgi:hypothetical protein